MIYSGFAILNPRPEPIHDQRAGRSAHDPGQAAHRFPEPRAALLLLYVYRLIRRRCGNVQRIHRRGDEKKTRVPRRRGFRRASGGSGRRSDDGVFQVFKACAAAVRAPSRAAAVCVRLCHGARRARRVMRDLRAGLRVGRLVHSIPDRRGGARPLKVPRSCEGVFVQARRDGAASANRPGSGPVPASNRSASHVSPIRRKRKKTSLAVRRRMASSGARRARTDIIARPIKP